MDFELKTYYGAGEIKLGMTAGDVRKCLDLDFETFERTSSAEYPCDHFKSIGVFVYYKKPYIVEAIEFSYPANPTLYNNRLLQLSYVDINRLFHSYDDNMEIEEDSIVSYKLGIGAYVPKANEDPKKPAESIILFERGYYD